MATIANIRRLIEEAGKVEKSLEKTDAVAVIAQKELSATRGHATRVVIWAYAVIAVLITLFIAGSAFFPGDFSSANSNLLELLKIGVVPIVTFVIGHYYGSSGK